MPATPNAARGTPGVDTSRIEQILADLELAGMGPPGADTYEPQQFQASGFQRFLEGLSPLASQQMGPPQGFGGGLIQGLSRGLGNAGARIGDEREAFQEAEAKRRASNDALRLEATREHRKAAFGELRAGRERDQKLSDEQAKYERGLSDEQAKHDRDNPPVTEALLREKPWLKRQGVKVGDRVPSSVAFAAPPEPKGAEDGPLVAIEGPNGPVYVTRAEALGKSPARTTRTNQPVKGADRQALAYYNRGKQAIETLATPDAKGATLEQRVSANLARQIGLQFSPDWLKSPDARAYRQAQRAFTEARLRKESGAAIPPHEYEADATTYFVQPGDDPAAIEQKRISRDVVLQGLAYGAGPAYEEFYGEKFNTTASAAPGTAESRVQGAPSTVPKPGGFFATNKPKARK